MTIAEIYRRNLGRGFNPAAGSLILARRFEGLQGVGRETATPTGLFPAGASAVRTGPRPARKNGGAE